MTACVFPKSPLPTPLRQAAVAAVMLLCGTEVPACSSGSVVSALSTARVSAKFALASTACGDAAAPGADPAPRSQHAQQLGLYDTPVELPAPRVTSATPTAAGPQQVDTPRPVSPRRIGREAVSRALALVPEVDAVATQYGIDPLLLHAIAHVESRHDARAVSHAGAMGLMQVMPATARRFGVAAPASQLRDPRVSLQVSSAYLKTLQRRFGNDLTLVIAAYNAGEGAVEKYGRRVPPYRETQGYVRDVLAHYRLLLGARDAIRPATKPAL